MPSLGGGVNTAFALAAHLCGHCLCSDVSEHHNTVDLLLMWCLRFLSYGGESAEQVHCVRQS